MAISNLNNNEEEWILDKLPNVVEILMGQSPPSSSYNKKNEGLPFFQGNKDFGEKYPTVTTYTTKPTKVSEKGDVLISVRAPIGDVNLSFEKSCIGRGLAALRPNGKIDNLFLYYFIQTMKNYLRTQGTGTTFSGISKRNLEEIEISYPKDITTQKEIALAVEYLLTKNSTALLNIKKAKRLIKKFRQSVLTAAVTGKLTEDWRTQNGNYEWEATVLSTVIKEKPRNGYSPKPVDYPTKVKSLTLSATTSGLFNANHYKYIDENIPNDSHLWLKPGDILIQRANSYELVGVSAIYKGEEHEFIYPDLMMKIKPNERAIGEFIYYVLSAPQTRTYFRQNSTGTSGNMPKINQGTVMNTPISLPRVEEQKEIVQKVEGYLEIAKKVEIQIGKAEARISKLTQAILTKTFNNNQETLS